MIDAAVAEQAIGTGILFDLGVLIISATFLALIARLLKQPLIVGYILAGVLIGPEVLGLVTNHQVISTFAELGIAFLLFIVGLELDLSKLREVKSVVIGAATAEVSLVFLTGLTLAIGFGFGPIPAIYVGLLLAFNSTAILIKMLSDKNELDTLHGRIVLGVLLIEDVIVVLALSILTTLPTVSLSMLGNALIKGMGLLALAIVSSRWVWPTLLKKFEDSQEVLFLVALSALFIFVGFASEFGFSTAVGGFLAGISLASFPFNIEISERARSLRDFFVTIFFVSLGLLISFSSVLNNLVFALVLLIVVVLLKPFIVYSVASLYGYSKRTSFLSGLSLSQLSEFSLVVVTLGVAEGHIGDGIFSVATVVMIISVSLTSYFVKYDRKMYELLSDFLLELGHRNKEEEIEEVPDKLQNHTIICGAHIKGRKLIDKLQELGEPLIAIDYNPEIIRKLKVLGIPVIYGNVAHLDILERVNFSQAKRIISTVPDEDDNLFLLAEAEKRNPEAEVFLTANNPESALLMYDKGADYVISPKALASEKLASTFEEVERNGNLEDLRLQHIKQLEHRKEEDILNQYEPSFLKDLKRRVSH